VIDLLGYELAFVFGGSCAEARFELGLPRPPCCAAHGFPQPEASSQPAAHRRRRHHARARAVGDVCGVRVQTRLSSMIVLSAALLEDRDRRPARSLPVVGLISAPDEARAAADQRQRPFSTIASCRSGRSEALGYVSRYRTAPGRSRGSSEPGAGALARPTVALRSSYSPPPPARLPPMSAGRAHIAAPGAA
jgi:hypothetical protein